MLTSLKQVKYELGLIAERVTGIQAIIGHRQDIVYYRRLLVEVTERLQNVTEGLTHIK